MNAQHTRGDLRGSSQGPHYPWYIAPVVRRNHPRWERPWQPRHLIEGTEGPLFDTYEDAQRWVEEQIQ